MNSLRVLIIPGHGLWDRKTQCWQGLPDYISPDAAKRFLIEAHEFAIRGRWDIIVYSGGRTRPDHPAVLAGLDISEAAGLRDFAIDHGLNRVDTCLLDELSRDSGENCFLPLLLVHRQFDAAIGEVGVCSLAHKAPRFMLVMSALGLGSRFQFHSVGDGPDDLHASVAGECGILAKILRHDLNSPGGYDLFDPLLRDPSLRAKREQRSTLPSGCPDYLSLMQQTLDAEGGSGPVGRLLAQIEALSPGPAWRELDWPWKQEHDR